MIHLALPINPRALLCIAIPLQILLRLLPPLGLGPNASEVEVEELAASLNVPLDSRGRLHFHRTAYELVRRTCEIDLPAGAVRSRLDKTYKQLFHHVEKGSVSTLAKSLSKVVASALSTHRKRLLEEEEAEASARSSPATRPLFNNNGQL